SNSVFNDRMNVFTADIQIFFDEHPDNKYDLIVSNPPFFINSLESPRAKTTLAKHTDADFFVSLMRGVAAHLSPNGKCWYILPVQTVELIKSLALQNGMYLQREINIRSFEHSEPHREIVCFGFIEVLTEISTLTIYKTVNIYTEEYKKLLQPYFIAF
ncbi:MAG: hypothetical protein ABIN13_17575, partial [Mucilaginibacter sp.]